MPSLLATVDTTLELREPWKSEFEYLQYFASGRAATALAFRRAVRGAMLKRLDPEQGKRIREAGAVSFNAGVDAEAPRARIQFWIDDESPVVVSGLRETSERLTREAQEAVQVSAQSADDARNAQRLAEEAQEAAVGARAEADRLCQESEAADREGAQNALEDAQAELANAQGSAEDAQDAVTEAATSDVQTRTLELEEAQANVQAAEQDVRDSQQALDDAIAKERGCQQAQQRAEELKEKADDTELLGSARQSFAEKALQDSTAAGLIAEKIRKRADAAAGAAQGLDTSEEGIINMWLLDNWVMDRGYGIDFNQWLSSVSADELAIGIRELEIP